MALREKNNFLREARERIITDACKGYLSQIEKIEELEEVVEKLIKHTLLLKSEIKSISFQCDSLLKTVKSVESVSGEKTKLKDQKVKALAKINKVCAFKLLTHQKGKPL